MNASVQVNHMRKRKKSRGKAGRNLTVRDDDIFIVSYPKSGNTWTRFLLGNLLYQDANTSFANIETRIPDIYKNTDNELNKMIGPRVLKSHEYFDPRYRCIVYIVRDPRDIVVSYYHYLVKRRVLLEGYSIMTFCKQYVNGELNPFGTWGENVGSWFGAKIKGKQFCLLRYEDMLHDPADALRKIALSVGIETSSYAIQRAVESSTFETMRALEGEQSLTWIETKDTRTDMSFIRSGKRGSWRTELPDEGATLIVEAWGDLMTELKYLCSS